MAFGKKGRPPEDRLARQSEIFQAVAPLILQDGARTLSMRKAAQTACLSVGGLYYYFPTKRDLILHGLCPSAIQRYCDDFHAQCEYLLLVDPQRYIDRGIEVVAQQVKFCRPSIHAALELGTASFWEVVEAFLVGTAGAFEAYLRLVVPEISDQELSQWGRAIRRSIIAALFDRSITPDEFLEELRMLAERYPARSSLHAQEHLEAFVSTSISTG